MASIREVTRKGGKRFEVRYSVRDAYERRLQRTKTFRRKVDAEKFRRKVEHEADTGELRDPALGNITFAALVEQWQRSPRWDKLKPTTAARYRSVIGTHLLPRWGTVRIKKITRADADAWIKELNATARPAPKRKKPAPGEQRLITPGTVQKVYGVWRAALAYAVFLDYLRENPAKEVESLPRVPRQEMLFLTPDEVEALATAVGPRYHSLILTAAYTGMRAGELVGLKRGRCDLLRGRITVAEALVRVDKESAAWTTPKNHRGRVIPIPKFLCKALAEHFANVTSGGTGPDALVWPNATGHHLVWSSWYRHFFRPAVRASLPARLHGLRFHDLRHTCAAILIGQKVHPKGVSDILGHGSISITMDRYGHLLPNTHDEITTGLDALHAKVERRCGEGGEQPG